MCGATTVGVAVAIRISRREVAALCMVQDVLVHLQLAVLTRPTTVAHTFPSDTQATATLLVLLADATPKGVGAHVDRAPGL